MAGPNKQRRKTAARKERQARKRQAARAAIAKFGRTPEGRRLKREAELRFMENYVRRLG